MQIQGVFPKTQHKLEGYWECWDVIRKNSFMWVQGEVNFSLTHTNQEKGG